MSPASIPVGETRAPRTGGVRFAPSPTGRFHLGNLRTAWISHLFAQHLQVPWVVRVEDIDRPRVQPGARESQLSDMATCGFRPDILLIQSEFSERHWRVFNRAKNSNKIYACDCSRKDVAAALATHASAPNSAEQPTYSGRCRNRDNHDLRARETLAWRFRMPDESGRDDFIIARTENISGDRHLPDPESFVPSYHWACAIDDYDGDYRLLVRGADLAQAANLQRAIFEWLSQVEERRNVPAIFHTALIVQADGRRLEKRTEGITLPELSTRGVEAPQLLQRFSASFDPLLLQHEFAPGEIKAEERGRITLSELGIPSQV